MSIESLYFVLLRKKEKLFSSFLLLGLKKICLYVNPTPGDGVKQVIKSTQNLK